MLQRHTKLVKKCSHYHERKMFLSINEVKPHLLIPFGDSLELSKVLLNYWFKNHPKGTY